MWTHTGKARPDFAETPGPGEESVWDYPRPPALVEDAREIEVRDGDALIARTSHSYRILETASPPTFYLPPDCVEPGRLVRVGGSSACEWKGIAAYWALASNPATPVAWSYPDPRPAFARIKDHFAFYPDRLACFVSGERVRPQPGRFYGGWITAEVVGPFKGEPGTGHW